MGYGHVLLYRAVVCERCCGIHIFASTRGILRGEGVRRRSNELQLCTANNVKFKIKAP